MRRTIFAIAGDPGGAAALAPVLAVLQQDRRYWVFAYPYRHAREVWAELGLPGRQLESADEQMAVELLASHDTDLLLTATSCNGLDLEKVFIAAARRAGVSSLCVLDFWSNYRLRFADPRDTLGSLPDLIAVMDDFARQEMLELGFGRERLRITGQPAFDGLRTARQRLTLERHARIREDLGVGPEDYLVLFLSQPLSDICGEGPGKLPEFGFSEQSVIPLMLGALDSIAERESRRLVVVLRPHPMEDEADLAAITSAAAPRHITTFVSSELSGPDAVLAADLVVGMNTVLLVEAALMNCTVVSLQPGLRLPDPVATNRLGMSEGVYQAEEIEDVLGRLIRRGRASDPPPASLPEGATQRIIELIGSQLDRADAR